MNRSLPEGLDQRFLQFIGVTEETERDAHVFYLKLFRPGQEVLDLGCGAGYFVKMLREQNIEARGIDLDPLATAQAQAQGLPVSQGEAMAYLQTLPDNSLDAIFSAHLVEHLEVDAVFHLIREAYRVLKPGGFLLLTTPNVRALVSHLEMFWLHFDHKRFYHPRLLKFFMSECNFSQITYGENHPGPRDDPASTDVNSDSTGGLSWNAIIPQPQRSVMLPWWWFKKWLAQLIVIPYLDAIIPAPFVGHAFEVYVIGYKGTGDG
jgi:SAM-dependent methyltransferase